MTGDASATTFLGCRMCGVMVPIPLIRAGDFPDDAADTLLSLSEFLRAHAYHPIAQLQKSGSDAVADRPLWDPMAQMQFEISDGREIFVARSERSSIDEPRTFRFAPGQLESAITEVMLDFHDLRRSLDLAFYPHALRPTKVENLLELLRVRIAGLEGAKLDIAFDDGDDPDVSIARMPAATLEAVIADAATIFDAFELDKLTSFLRANSGEDGPLALRLRRTSRS